MAPWIQITLMCFQLSRLALTQESGNQDAFQHFVTRPDIIVPLWNMTVFDKDALGEGLFFVAPYANLIQTTYPLWNGPLIFDPSGELIWSGAPLVEYHNTFDFRVSRINGRDMLSFIWPGEKPNGEGHLMDSSYQVYKTIDMRGDQMRANMHDLHLIEDGTRALMLTTPHQTPSYLSIPGMYEGQCKIDRQGFKEVDVSNNEILFEWNSENHLDASESTYWTGNASERYHLMCPGRALTFWDITHMNAIDKFPDGDYLLSARHMDTIYKISHQDGSIVWRLGGVKSDFVFIDERAIFSRQHHVRFRGQNSTHILLSVFDNAVGDHGIHATSFESWGLLIALRIDVSPMTVELVSRYQKPFSLGESLQEKSRGSVSFLSNGNAVVGWPRGSQLAEYTHNGRMLMHMSFTTAEAASYRAYKMPWVGRPSQPPDVVATVLETKPQHPTTEVYVSWNGATEVRSWDFLRTDSVGNASELVGSTARTGFETKFTIDGIVKQMVVVALDEFGREIGRSNVAHVGLPQRLQSTAADEEKEWLQTQPSAWQPPPAVIPSEGPTFSLLELALFVSGVIASIVGIVVYLRRYSKRHSTQPTYELVVDNADHDAKSYSDTGKFGKQGLRARSNTGSRDYA